MGEWRTLHGDWLARAAVTCRLCGRPLFGRVWHCNGTDFCDTECEALFLDYWLPRYGTADGEGG